MTATGRFDEITEASLRARGSKKWSTYGNATAAWVAEMDFGAAPPITAAIESTVTQSLFGYLPDALDNAMAEACSNWQRDTYGWNVRPERIRPLPDVLKGLEVTITHFSKPGSAVVLPTPAYMPFLILPADLRRAIIEVPMLREQDDWRLDLDAIDTALAGRGGVVVLCNPHNPLGKMYSRTEMLELAETVEKHGARVFSDEIHAPLVYAGGQHVPYASVSDTAASHTITSTSASKGWNLPGLKCAQLILSNDQDARKWRDVGSWAEHGASNLGVVANTAAYSSGRQWLADVIDYLDTNRRLFAELIDEHLPGVDFTLPTATYLGWLDCRRLALGDHPFEFFLENASVACTDGALCGEVGAGHVRFNFATPRPVLRNAVMQMAEALKRR